MIKPPSDFLYIRATAKTGLIKTPFCQLTRITHTGWKKNRYPAYNGGSSLLYDIYTIINMYRWRAYGFKYSKAEDEQ